MPKQRGRCHKDRQDGHGQGGRRQRGIVLSLLGLLLQFVPLFFLFFPPLRGEPAKNGGLRFAPQRFGGEPAVRQTWKLPAGGRRCCNALVPAVVSGFSEPLAAPREPQDRRPCPCATRTRSVVARRSAPFLRRSEERRVGKECRSRW